MKLYHATTSRLASKILENGFRPARVWDHENVTFFSSIPLPDFGDLYGSSWIVIDVDETLLALDQYSESEKESDEEQYACKCFCLPTAEINACAMWEEQGLLARA